MARRPTFTTKRVSQPRKSVKHAEILDLKCFKEVRERILSGWALDQVAIFIQEDQHELPDLDRSDLHRLLLEYRKSLPPGDFLTVKLDSPVAQFLTPIHDQVANQLVEGLDELKELDKLYRLQIERIGIDLVLERKNQKLVSTMTQEIRLAKEILESSSQLKMDLGIAERHLGKVEMESRFVEGVAGQYGSKAVVAVMESPEKRQRLASVAQRMLLTDGNLSASVLEKFIASKKKEKEGAAAPVEKETSRPQELAEEELDPELVAGILAEAETVTEGIENGQIAPVEIFHDR